ncbi:hypothetical protein J2Z64_000078 [Oceanobacillus polygoni]|uniref:Uncharacterized protein n=1 Tax=Oceanobacillus polygoni TaxID=1235259 RepID=A0A9X1CE43_9BACI|nr:hypothetical protein [Oceanobacillus polygoni]
MKTILLLPTIRIICLPITFKDPKGLLNSKV